MKRLMFLLSVMLLVSSCVSAVPVVSHKPQQVTVITSTNRRVPSRHSKVVVKKKVIIGTRVKKLPPKKVVIYFNNSPFVYAEGVFYRKLSSAEYEVIKPEIGMIVPQLPEYNVEKVCLKGETLFLFDNTLYKQVPTAQGIQYKVVGDIN